MTVPRSSDRHKLPTRTATLAQVSEDIADVLRATTDAGKPATIFDAAYRRLSDSRPGTPGAQSYDRPKVVVSTDGSPAPRGALTVDPTASDRKELDKRLRRMEQDSKWLRQFTQRWVPKPATARDRAAAEVAEENEPLCANCVAHGFTDLSKGLSEKVHRHTTASDALDHPMALGRWCMDFAVKAMKDRHLYGDAALPDEEQLRQHYSGQRVRIVA